MSLLRLAVFVSVLWTIVLPGWPDEYVVDNDDGAPGYVESGDFTTSSTTGYNGGTYRFTDNTREPSAATWTPNIVTAGDYEVYAILRTSSNRPTDVPYTVTHAGGTSVVHISQYGPNMVQELYLGEYAFNTGTSGSVRMDNSGSAGAYIADAFRFVAPSDDPPSITYLSHRPSAPSASDAVSVTATITDDGWIASATMYYSAAPAGSSGSVPAYDDGAHDDGASGDNVYGAAIPPQPDGDTVSYSFAATDNASQTTTSAQGSYGINLPTPREYRSIWADTWNVSILNAGQCDDLIQTCRDNNMNTVMVEVRKIGDAYYQSNLEPRATNISGGASFDPLGYLIGIAHDTSGGQKYIEVHAWFVAHRITTGETLNPQHILARHPEYAMLKSDGDPYAGSTRYLDPGHPEAVDHNVAVIVDCLTNYPIDGINLDYIRYPEYTGEWGYNPVSVARFNDFYGKSGQPSGADPDWDDWRRECVTLEVKKIYVKSLMVDPDVVLTADTVNWGYSYSEAAYPGSSAYASVFQDWVGWLDAGILDYNALMDYSTNTSRFQGWATLSMNHSTKRGSIIGIGAYLQTSVQDSMDQLAWVRAQGAEGMNIYDWGSEVNAAPENRTQFYQQLKAQICPDWADPPIHPWKAFPTTGIFEGNLTDGDTPIDHGTVMVEGQPGTLTYTDGNGWYAILDVPPGAQTLRFSKPGYPDLPISADLPAAGDIVTVNADFAASVTGWHVY